jgi:hypothetical protein
MGLTITSVAVLFVLRDRLSALKKLVARLINPQLDKDSPLGILSEEEMKTIIALSGILIPTAEKFGINEEFIRNHVNYKTNNVKGYLKEYRNAVRLLEEASKKVISGDREFYELNLSERDRVLESILWRYSSNEVIKSRLERILVSKRNMAFRDFVVRDILAAFKGSPVGWFIVGYSHYPGVPSTDPRDYTAPLELPPH